MIACHRAKGNPLQSQLPLYFLPKCLSDLFLKLFRVPIIIYTVFAQADRLFHVSAIKFNFSTRLSF